MKLSELVANWIELDASQNIEINGICLDSRTLQKGNAFIALTDAHYIAKASGLT